MGILSKLPEQLKDLMLEKGIKASALSKAIGVSDSTISRYTQGLQMPAFEILVALAEYFDCSIDFLLGLTDIPRRENQRFKPVPAFATQFRVAMKACGFSQYALQKKTKISWASFNAWLRGQKLPYPDSLIKIANAMDCSVDFLLGRED